MTLVSRAIVQAAGLRAATYWTPSGPTDELFNALEHELLSSGELTMLRVSLDVWNGQGGATVGQVLKLDGRLAHVVLAMLSAVLAGQGEIWARKRRQMSLFGDG